MNDPFLIIAYEKIAQSLEYHLRSLKHADARKKAFQSFFQPVETKKSTGFFGIQW